MRHRTYGGSSRVVSTVSAERKGKVMTTRAERACWKARSASISRWNSRTGPVDATTTRAVWANSRLCQGGFN